MKEFNLDNYIIQVKEQYKSNKSLQDVDWGNSLVIGDMHFGVHQNSTVWLSNQTNFIKKQILPLIRTSKELNLDSIVFLGDLFDSRQSINIVIANTVLNVMTNIINEADKYGINVYLIGGNHDYYSSFEDKSELNCYNLIFNKEYKEKHQNLHIITTGVSYIKKQSGYVMLLPWFESENTKNLIKNINKASEEDNCYGIYCHADTITFTTDERRKIFADCKVPIWSGHIHYRRLNNASNIFQLGAAYAFNFNDANQDRFIYIINEKNNSFIEIKNELTPLFKTFNYDEKEKIDFDYLDKDDYYTFYTRSENIKDVRKLIKQYSLKNTNIKLLFDNISFNEKTNYLNALNTNIDEFILSNIPTNLKDLYKSTVDKYKKTSSKN